MNEFLIFLHFVGLMIGAAGGITANILMRKARAMPPEEAMIIRKLGPLLAMLSAIGLTVLWITGLILVWSKWGGLGNLPGLFWLKLLLVVVFTGLIGVIHMTFAQIRKGNPAAATRLPILGPMAATTVILIVLVAVYTFV